ncbi:MAG: hypothetical protein ACE5EE_09165 [Fidelibacterota bacterium]
MPYFLIEPVLIVVRICLHYSYDWLNMFGMQLCHHPSLLFTGGTLVLNFVLRYPTCPVANIVGNPTDGQLSISGVFTMNYQNVIFL